ncbi:N-acetyltransferase [Aestuariivirga litoralis]|uniref:N-acetyltransferase n=1 Tax=Aestuariivirga litoralis TaxID=2650924 RepID=A0A2W2BUH6_9HYPH|nr:GNAT family N-acetyltransferase [Aestuariivirga litoralis]PZF77136.1 N-acetyltransferase [Aestuariivirga litoralis]
MTTLTTDRLTLRPPLATDAEALVPALNNFNVSRWTGRIPFPYGPDDAAAFLAHHLRPTPDELMLMITRAGTVIGGIGVGSGELGYWLAEPHWGQGYGTEAARALTDHAFEVLEREELVASYHIGNAASRRILLGLGFVETGEGSAFSRARQAEVRHIKLRLARDAWREAKERRR